MSVKCRAKNPATCRYHGNPVVKVPQVARSSSLNNVKTYSTSQAFHIGDLNPLSKKNMSFEGQGLSISEDPSAWQKIARLSGKVWKVDTNLNLLDFHKLTATQKEEIYSYAETLGWVERKTVYSVSWFDDEWEQTMTMRFDSLDEAQEEAEPFEGDIEKLEDWAATNTFPDSTVKTGDNGSELLDKLSVLWVERNRTDLQGVWWDDIHDISRLSAPRGVICMNRIPKLLGSFK